MMQPDFEKERFRIIITVKENCQTIDIEHLDGKQPTYQEFIGAIQISLMRYVFNQTGYNIEEYMKWKEQKSKEESENKTSDVK